MADQDHSLETSPTALDDTADEDGVDKDGVDKDGVDKDAIDSHRKHRLFLILIFAVGALLRLTYLFELHQAPDFAQPQFESQYHDYWARAIVTDDWTPPSGVTDPEIRERPYFRPPGYPYFLAAIYQVFGLGYTMPRLIQALLGLLNAWLAYRLAFRFFGSRVGLFTAALMANYWIFIFFEGEFMALTLLIALLLGSLNTLLNPPANKGSGLFWPMLSGLLLGAAAVVRPNVLVLIPCWLAWLWFDRENTAGRPRLIRVGVLAIACLIPILPVTWRNLQIESDVVWITSNAGINLFVGNHPQSDGFTPGVPELGELTGMSGWDSFDYPKIARAVEANLGRELTDAEVSSYFSRRALDYLTAEPLGALTLAGRKLALFFGPDEVSNNKILTLERRHSPSLRVSLGGLGFGALFALAILGAGTVFAGWQATDTPARRVVGLMGASVLIYSASFLPFFAAARFRVPILPFLMFFGAIGLDALIRQIEARRYRPMFLGSAALVLLLGLTHMSWIAYEPDASLWHYRRGLLYRMQEAPREAVIELRQAVDLAPQNPEARFALADELAKVQRFDEAILEYRAVLDIQPEWGLVYNNLATALAQKGDLDAAIAAWEQSLALDPQRLSALNNLALTLATRPDPHPGDRERAVELAERACEATQYAQPALINTLALAYRAADRLDDFESLRQRLEALTTTP